MRSRPPMLVLCVLALAVTIVCAAVLILVRRTSGGASGSGTTAPTGQLVSYGGQTNGNQAVDNSEPGWPHKITSGNTTIFFYHPEIEKWQGDQIQAYTAVSVENSGSNQRTYGKVYFTTRAIVDKTTRQVTLDNFRVTRADFPTASDRASEYLSIIQQAEGDKTEVVPEDQLLSDVAISQAERKSGRELRNDPPRIIYSNTPAVLVLIDGQPVLKPAGEGDLQRVINTRALILFDQGINTYYLSLMNGWVQAPSAEGPWTFASRVPAAADKIRAAAAKSGQVDLLNGGKSARSASSGRVQRRAVRSRGSESLSGARRDGTFPTVYVSTVPAELLTSDGDLQFKPITGTGLLYVSNSGDQIFMNTANQEYYVLISGRWFAAKSMEGPWAYVDGKDLPADFAKIPEGDPKASVLASTPGTAAAQEAAIANEIPQTATINRQEAHLTVQYDGDPRFEQIPGSNLQTAINSGTPVIEVASNQFLAVQDGVWFTSASALGPWVVATSVPPEVYTIPPRSRVHNVTYVRVYGYNDDVVYTGYTPGYYGTVEEPDGVVAYGTGWYYPPYIGSYWTGWPWTYGFGAGFGWSPVVGWGFGFGSGFLAPFYSPWWAPFGVGWGSPAFGFAGFPVLGFGWGFPTWGWGAPAWGWGAPVAGFGFASPVWGSGWGGHVDRFGWAGGFGGVRTFSVFDRWGRSAFVGTHAGWTGGSNVAGNVARAGFANRAGFGGNLRGGFNNQRMGAAGMLGGNSRMGLFGGTRAGAAANSRIASGGGANAGAFGNAKMNGRANQQMGAAGNSRLGAAGNTRAFAGSRGGFGNARGNALASSRAGMTGSRGNAFAGSRGGVGNLRGNAFGGSRSAAVAPRMGSRGSFAGSRAGVMNSPRMGGFGGARGGAPRFAASPRGGFNAQRMGGGFSAPRMGGGGRGGFGGGGRAGAFAAPRAFGGGGGGFGGGHGGGGFAGGRGGGGFGGGGHGGGGGGGHRR